MEIWEVVLIGIGLAMDAVAVSLSDGMAQPRMKPLHMLCIAGAFALFQFGMPLLGYFLGSVFSSFIEKIAPYLSFALLCFIGGKMIFDGFMAKKEGKQREENLGVGKILLQAVATSIDALAVGVTFLAAETSVGLPMPVFFCTLVIGAITLLLSLPAVLLGKKVGDKFSDKAEILGGVVLVLLGIKILLEGIL